MDFFLFAIIYSFIRFFNRVRFAYVIGSSFVKALSRLPITLFLCSRSRTYNSFVHILFHASEVSLSLSDLLDEETGSYTVTLFMTWKLPPLISPIIFAFRAVNSMQRLTLTSIGFFVNCDFHIDLVSNLSVSTEEQKFTTYQRTY